MTGVVFVVTWGCHWEGYHGAPAAFLSKERAIAYAEGLNMGDYVDVLEVPTDPDADPRDAGMGREIVHTREVRTR